MIKNDSMFRHLLINYSFKETKLYYSNWKKEILDTRFKGIGLTSRNSPGFNEPSVYAPKSVRVNFVTFNPTKPSRIFTSWYYSIKSNIDLLLFLLLLE